jgi:hypothetical protein
VYIEHKKDSDALDRNSKTKSFQKEGQNLKPSQTPIKNRAAG